MRSFLDIFRDRQDVLLEKLAEHIQLSLIALIIAMLIAVPIGLFLTRHKRAAEGIIGLAAILQTIPSLALLAFLIPLFGIGKVPAVMALVAYGLLPILRNTYTGITGVDPVLVEAATGMGMNGFKRLIKIELPLAMPVIMAGIRTSMVLIVGTATIAALIGAGGLGELILLGLDRGADVNLILLGAIPAALLAIVLDAILRLLEKSSRTIGIKSFALLVVVFLLAAILPFAWQANKKPDLVIGGKLGSEPEILINMYKQLIEHDTKLNVQLKPGLGKTAFVFKALQNGEIDIYPEFTGTAIFTHLGEEAKSNLAGEVYSQAAKGMKEKYNMRFLKPMRYNNTYAVAVSKQTADQYHLKNIGDLKKVQDQLTAGLTLEFKDRSDGYKGIQSVYDVHFSNLKTMDPGIRQKALQNNDVDVINAYATDSYMVKMDLVTLKDPKHLFPPYQGAPLLKEKTLKQHPEIEKALNKLSGKITDEEMRKMNYQVDYNGKSAEQVARSFLKEKGLLP